MSGTTSDSGVWTLDQIIKYTNSTKCHFLKLIISSDEKSGTGNKLYRSFWMSNFSHDFKIPAGEIHLLGPTFYVLFMQLVLYALNVLFEQHAGELGVMIGIIINRATDKERVNLVTRFQVQRCSIRLEQVQSPSQHY